MTIVEGQSYLDGFSVVLFSRLQGKSQVVQDELVRLGEQMVHSAEGTRALALELCREFEDKFLLHIAGGEVSPRRKTTVASLWPMPYRYVDA